MIQSKQFGSVKIHYRANDDGTISGDERIITEVIESACYRRKRDNFDVEKGEAWLDLGANIGAFGVYCKLRGARAFCYEPEPECFKLLKKNVGQWATQAAVVGQRVKSIPFHTAPNSNARGTVHAVKGYGAITVPAVYAGYLARTLGPVDGIKMDIEGSEFDILDNWLLPKSKKLVLEYHTSRDSSVKNLKRRLEVIKRHYKNVRYRAEYDRVFVSGATEFKAYFDRLIFAWN